LKIFYIKIVEKKPKTQKKLLIDGIYYGLMHTI